MTRTVRRWLVMLAGTTGLVALLPGAAQALENAPHVAGNHCEPVRRSS
jgi:hypothetical protein